VDHALTSPALVAVVRSRIARAVLGPLVDVPATLGTIRLRDRQRSLAGRVVRLIGLHRGALLADPVGLGKTYTALAVARDFERVVVVTPGALREMWTAACASATTECRIVTHESLSRAMPALPGVDRRTLIVVDEAHRFRNPATRRYSRLTVLARDARLLLISATPIQNRLEDLAAPLALFVGAEAFSLSADALARYVVREKTDPASGDLPTLAGPTRLPVAVDPSILESILRLPAPLPASDEGVAAALIAQLLVRRWTSSQAALGQSLRRLLARTLALRDAALVGRSVARQDLRLWEIGDDAVQLPFPALLGTATSVASASDTIGALETHAAALRSLLRGLARSEDADAGRARALSEIRCRHPGERIVAFSQYARTIDALFARLSATGGVAALTASGARIASGRITRAECIEQFTPDGNQRPRGAAPIELLLATDLLSEGLNLQRASVVVHLDLPWNPARLDQRIGRVRRLGSHHARVAVYFVDPVGVSDAAREVERRLRAKLRVARDTIGVADGILATDSRAGDAAMPAIAETLGDTQRLLEDWRGPCALGVEQMERDDIVVAAVRGCRRGWVCAYGAAPSARVLAELDGRVSDEPRHVQAALVIASGSQIEIDRSRVAASLEAARRWIAARHAARAVDLRAALTGRTRRDLQSRIAQVVARAPRHRRSAIARAATLARTAITMSLGLGAEEALHQLVAADVPDEDWLDAVADFARSNATEPRATTSRDQGDDERIVAMIVFDAAENQRVGAS